MDDTEERLVGGATEELRFECEEEGDLGSDLMFVDTVEDAVELGVIEGGIKVVDEFGLRSSDRFARDEGGFGVVAGASEIV